MWNRGGPGEHERKRASAGVDRIAEPTASTSREEKSMDNAVASIGKSVVVVGDVIGFEDIFIDGQVEGRIEVPNHNLTIGSNAKIHAPIVADTVTIIGGRCR